MKATDYLRPDDWLVLDGGGPRYLQLRKRLEAGIGTGVLSPDSALPPEREIAEITGLSRVTVRKAIQELVQDGVIEQRQGSGSFINAPVQQMQSLSHLISFTEEMKRRGLEASSQWLERGVVMAPQEVAADLGVIEGEQVARLHRVRLADSKPIALEKAVLPLEFLPNPIEINGSLYDSLAERNLRPTRATQKISAINLDSKEARLLCMEEGSAALLIKRTSFLTDHRVVEVTSSIFRGDLYDFVVELNS